MTVFMAALLLEKSQTSITESSSWPVLVKEAAERSSPLKGADLGRSKTGNLRRFFLIADKGLGPEKKFTYKRIWSDSGSRDSSNITIFAYSCGVTILVLVRVPALVEAGVS